MTTQTQNAKPIVAEGLKPSELAELKACIAGVRSGQTEYFVLLTNKKQTNSRRRIAGVDYEANPALSPNAHKGWLVAAPLNKKGETYLHIFDEARAEELGENFGHTRATLRGLRSFVVETDPRTGDPITRPGPLAVEPVVEPVAAVEAPKADPALQAQAEAIALQAEALAAQAKALAAQAKR